ncbi:MAG: crossover junction endodeoxyribonuclease RuvC [Dehalococcoidia bacterium]|nr:crossover junction endodeoxyribonuclease RuvC [Dehalococcoidia bacterium]MCA9851570.1 crossover junction endodeoxyribonuclease RuvC [Dehalococcoidia bacterium]MCB9490706.1 crossover junction endodeoxyribonuclease RuvC [Dehalococcoidia bacterium]
MDGQTTALPRRVLGIDPGLAVSGYCLVDERGSGGHLVHCGALRSTAKQPRAERLYRIYGLVMALVAEYRPVELAIEQQFVAENVKSAMAIGEARAAAMVAAAAAGIPVYEFTPTAVKESVTGWGGAPKEQVAQMVAIHLGVTEVPGPLDVSDAAAIALTRLAEARLEEAMAR